MQRVVPQERAGAGVLPTAAAKGKAKGKKRVGFWVLPAGDPPMSPSSLIDEAGLCIVFEGSGAIVRLTLERPAPDGRLLLRTFERRVEFRN